MIAEMAGREALLVKPSTAAADAMAQAGWTRPRAMVATAVLDCATSRVGRRPIRSASTPPATAAQLPPRP
jgi:hypothetical protein